MRHYLVVSDLHLCDIENHPDGWKAYKHSRFCFDDAFDALVRKFLQQGQPADTRTLVLNGDIFDFDLVCAVPEDPPWPVSRWEATHGLEATEEKSCWKLARVLADHPRFVGTLARVVGAGHRVVYVCGNHDSEFHFGRVRQVLLAAVQEAAQSQGLEFEPERFVFEPWFFYVAGDIYAEHGQQYDSYTTFRYVLSPIVTTTSPPTIALPMGNLSNRNLMSQMGFFNPHASDYILNIFRYLAHWLKHYAFSWHRHQAIHWLLGSLYVLQRLYRTKNRMLRCPPDEKALLEQVAVRNALPLAKVEALHRLRRGPITNRAYRMVREFWIDRLLLALLMTLSTAVLLVVSVPLWIKLMLPLSSFPLLFLVYEWFAHGETIFSVERQTHKSAEKIAKLLPVRVVTFGHTHVPGLIPLRPGVVYVNTGTWAPVTRQRQREHLVPGLRNALVASFPSNGSASVTLDTCLDDELARDDNTTTAT